MNWANLSTPLGLLVARCGGAEVTAGPRRLVLAQGYRYRFPSGMAFTVGDVVISASRFDELVARHPGLLRHEEAHSRQWAACFGLPFLPLYIAATAWSYLVTGDRASGNWFERSAGLAAGGYRRGRPRPVLRRAASHLARWGRPRTSGPQPG